MNVARTSGLRAKANVYATVGVPLQLGPDVAALEFEPAGPPPAAEVEQPPPARLTGAIEARLAASATRGRPTILVDEWGPYDYRSPRLWPIGKAQDRPLKFRVLGPAGKWTLRSIRGGTTTSREGVVPGELTVTPAASGTDLEIALEYVGGAVVSSRGQAFAAGARVPFTYTTFDPAFDWTVMYWKVDPPTNPLAGDPFAKAFDTSPIRAEAAQRIDLLTSGPLGTGLPADWVVMRAETVATLAAGSYELGVTSDDGVRVWIDDKLVIDRWNVHETAVDRVPLAGGRHRVKIEYFEATGWAELQVRVWRKN